MWIWVLVAVVLAAGLLAMALGVLGTSDNEAADAVDAVNIAPPPSARRPDPPKNYPKLEPWRGLRQGMTQQQVRDQFGDPQKVRRYRGEETWEIYEDAEGSGIFRSTGAKFGQWVRIRFDRSGKVVMFWHDEAENTADSTDAPTPP